MLNISFSVTPIDDVSLSQPLNNVAGPRLLTRCLLWLRGQTPDEINWNPDKVSFIHLVSIY